MTRIGRVEKITRKVMMKEVDEKRKRKKRKQNMKGRKSGRE